MNRSDYKTRSRLINIRQIWWRTLLVFRLYQGVDSFGHGQT